MKTAKNWFMCLGTNVKIGKNTYNLREMAINNTKKESTKKSDKLAIKYKTFSSCLFYSFNWDDTLGGHEFWNNIFKEALLKENNGKLMYYVVAAYPFDFNFSLDTKIEKIGEKLGFETSGSGCGFGMRDISFIITTKESKIEALTEKFKKELKKLNKKAKLDYEMTHDC